MHRSEISAIAEKHLLERQKLPEAFSADTVRPNYDGLGLANIAALATHWLCPEAPSLCEQPALPPFAPDLLASEEVTAAWGTWLEQAPINHLVLMLWDGLGYDQLQTVMAEGDAPGLAAICQSPQTFFMPATSVFPTTTVTALASVTTAYAPAQHGLVGTHIYLSEIGSLVDFIAWRPTMAPTSTPYSDTQLNPDTILKVPNLYLRLEKAGVGVEIINFYQFKDTSISRFTTTGSHAGKSGYISYLTWADGFAQLRERLQANNNQGKSFTYVYVPNIDAVSHRYGPLSSCYRAEVAALDFSLRREILQPLAGRRDTVLILTGDHGQVHMNQDRLLWLDQHPHLTKHMLFPATGKSAGRFLHLKPGALAAARDYIEEHLSEHFLVLSKTEVLELGLFGQSNQPVSAQCYDRIGDLVLFPRADWTCHQHIGTGEAKRHTAIGGHGGLKRAEMLIPFLGYRF